MNATLVTLTVICCASTLVLVLTTTWAIVHFHYLSSQAVTVRVTLSLSVCLSTSVAVNLCLCLSVTVCLSLIDSESELCGSSWFILFQAEVAPKLAECHSQDLDRAEALQTAATVKDLRVLAISPTEGTTVMPPKVQALVIWKMLQKLI